MNKYITSIIGGVTVGLVGFAVGFTLPQTVFLSFAFCFLVAWIKDIEEKKN